VQVKGILGQHQRQFDYPELNPKIIRGRSGDPGWSNIGWFILVLALPFALFNRYFAREMYLIIMTSLFFLTATAFILRYVQFDYAAIETRTGHPAVFIWLRGWDREARENMAQYPIQKILRADSPKNALPIWILASKRPAACNTSVYLISKNSKRPAL
jgi:hypothetical protein